MKLSIARLNSIVFISCLTSSVEFAYAADPKKDEAKTAETNPTPAVETLTPGTDYLCEVDVYYSWKPTPPIKKMAEHAAAGKADAEPTTTAPIRSFFTVAGESGVVKDEVRNRLEAKMPRIHLQALEECRSKHQDQTSCVAEKMRESKVYYSKLDFSSRRAMLEAITEDCEKDMGTCIGAEVSATRCFLNHSPDASPESDTPPKEANGEAAKTSGKDAGKDSKKK